MARDGGRARRVPRTSRGTEAQDITDAGRPILDVDHIQDFAQGGRAPQDHHPGHPARAGLLAHFVIADLDGRPPMVYLETAAHGQVWKAFTNQLKAVTPA